MEAKVDLLRVNNLNKRFGGLHAVDDVSFGVPGGIIKAVIGPNGAGKTTLFNCIAGSLPPSGGTVTYRGETITGLRPNQIAGLGITRTFQNIKLSTHMTVLENVKLGRHSRSSAGFLSALFNLPHTWKEEKGIEEKARETLAELGIERLSDETVSNLPFGNQRAVELARALTAEPRLLLLDEPAAGLNIHETEELARQIELIKDRGITVLLVEHDMSLVMDISEEIVVLNFGKMIAEGKPEDVQRNEEVISIYLGEVDA
jgi:branched-chain amino acid transport system ATP-binding protein